MGSFYRLQNYYKHKPMATAMSSYNLKSYMNSKGGKEFMDERAPSTADIMKRMEEEKERQSQTLDKKEDKSKDDDSAPESVKESYKPDSSGEDNSQTGDTSHGTI